MHQHPADGEEFSTVADTRTGIQPNERLAPIEPRVVTAGVFIAARATYSYVEAHMFKRINDDTGSACAKRPVITREQVKHAIDVVKSRVESDMEKNGRFA